MVRCKVGVLVCWAAEYPSASDGIGGVGNIHSDACVTCLILMAWWYECWEYDCWFALEENGAETNSYAKLLARKILFGLDYDWR